MADYASEDRGPIQRAARVLQDHNLVAGGNLSWQDLGYRTMDGQVPAWKVHEELYLMDLVSAAIVELGGPE